VVLYSAPTDPMTGLLPSSHLKLQRHHRTLNSQDV